MTAPRAMNAPNAVVKNAGAYGTNGTNDINAPTAMEISDQKASNPTPYSTKEATLGVPLTPFERADVLGRRAKEIFDGTGLPIQVSHAGIVNAYDIAQKELSEGKLVAMIRRTHANGTVRLYRIQDLISS